MVRTHPFNLIAALVGMSALQGTAMLSPAIAGPAPNCTGEACEALKVSADGCLWTNATDKAVRFSLSEGATTIVSTVLAPGGNFREANKDACVTNKPESPQYQATFASLRQMPDAPDFTLKPKATAMARAVMPKPAIALPRAKPQAASIAMVSPPLPRAKPDTTAVPSAPPSNALPPQVAQAAEAPTEIQIAQGANPCGDACSEILFKRVDNCIWVQSQNPRPIMFQATVEGRMIVLSLEGASSDKSNNAVPPTGVTAYHARQRDPFQSSSAGIPVYRARLGDKNSCATDRKQISHFVAVYRK